MKPIDFKSPSKAFTRKLSGRTRNQRNARRDAVALEAAASGPRRNDLLPELRLERRPIETLRAPGRATRKLNTAQVAGIARSISMFGMVEPVLITGDGAIVDGVSSVEAARSAGLSSVPCIVIDHLGKHELRLLRLALNRLQEKGEWNIEELKLEFIDLRDLGVPIEFSGFEPQEIDIVLLDDDAPTNAKANKLPTITNDGPPVSQEGDVWKLGRHRVYCGDATDPLAYAFLANGDEKASVIFSDPPYNIKIDGFAVGAGQNRHREFAHASGEMTDNQFVDFLARFLTESSDFLEDGSALFVCMDWRHTEHVQRAARQVGLSHQNTIVWAKGNAGLGGLYRSNYENVVLLCKGDTLRTNNVKLGKHGRDRTNLWTYPGANQRGSSAHAQAANHPTPKPVELIADAILDVTNRGEIVLDPFAGSGTTVIAAHQTGRIAYAIELDPGYVDLVVRRFEAFSGERAVLAGSEKSFDEVAAERQSTSGQPGVHSPDVATASVQIVGSEVAACDEAFIIKASKGQTPPLADGLYSSAPGQLGECEPGDNPSGPSDQIREI